MNGVSPFLWSFHTNVVSRRRQEGRKARHVMFLNITILYIYIKNQVKLILFTYPLFLYLCFIS